MPKAREPLPNGSSMHFLTVLPKTPNANSRKLTPGFLPPLLALAFSAYWFLLDYHRLVNSFNKQGSGE